MRAREREWVDGKRKIRKKIISCSTRQTGLWLRKSTWQKWAHYMIYCECRMPAILFLTYSPVCAIYTTLYIYMIIIYFYPNCEVKKKERKKEKFNNTFRQHIAEFFFSSLLCSYSIQYIDSDCWDRIAWVMKQNKKKANNIVGCSWVHVVFDMNFYQLNEVSVHNEFLSQFFLFFFGEFFPPFLSLILLELLRNSFMIFIVVEVVLLYRTKLWVHSFILS